MPFSATSDDELRAPNEEAASIPDTNEEAESITDTDTQRGGHTNNGYEPRAECIPYLQHANNHRSDLRGGCQPPLEHGKVLSALPKERP